MKREELKAYDGESIYRVLECTPHNDDELHIEECFNNKSEFKFYEKDEADKVMDAMEARIKELEAENKHLDDYIDAYQKSEALNIEKLDKKDERIKELREALIANDNHWIYVYKENIELKSKIRKLEGK